MAEDFFLDPRTLDDAVKKLEASSEALEKAYNNLIAVLGPLFGCWGNDDIGESFATNYVPSADQAREATRQAITAIRDFATAVEDSKETFESLDSESAARLDRMAIRE